MRETIQCGLRFSTDHLEPAGRFEAFRDALARGLFHFDLVTHTDTPYRGEVDLYVGSPAVFGKVLGSPAELVRSPALARQCEEGVWVLLTRSGRMRVTQGEVAHELAPGEGIVIDATRPHAGASLDESDTWVVQVPEALLRTLRSRDAPNRTTFLPADADITRMMLAVLEAHDRRARRGPATLDAMTAQYLADLVALSLGTHSDGAAWVECHGLKAGRLQRILDDIAQHFLDREIGAAGVARRLGVTPRYVHRLLEETGRTLSDHVLQHRLARARRLLLGPSARNRKIADIAYACGFNDLSYFNRTFRQRFGETPSDARAAGAGTHN